VETSESELWSSLTLSVSRAICIACVSIWSWRATTETPSGFQALQSEVRQLRQDLQTTTIAVHRAQILIYRLEGQEAAIVRTSQRLDELRDKFARIQDERKHLAADIKRHEDFIGNTENPPTQRKAVLSVDEIKTGIYEATCKACGWNGKVCGFSAVQIYYSLELEVKAQGTNIP
jgi:hypothetical protein